MAMIQAIAMPKWGMTMIEGKLVAWLARQGASVAKGQDLMEVETEKITNVVESPASGAIRRILVQPGATAPVGALLGVIADADAPDSEVDAFVAGYAERGQGRMAEAGGGPAARLVGAAGAKLNLLSLGQAGTPAVLLHGFGGDMGTWLFNQDALAAERRVVVFDLPSHGESEPLPEASASVEAIADLVDAALDALQVERAHLVGHSLGGAVALILAAARPERVASLALLAPAGLGLDISTEYLDGYVAADRRKSMKETLAKLFADQQAVTAAMVENVLRFKRRDGVSETLATLAQRLGRNGRQSLNLSDALARVTVPVLAIWGGKDAIVPLPQDWPANLRVQKIEGAGHMPMMEAAGEVNRLLAAHFQEAER